MEKKKKVKTEEKDSNPGFAPHVHARSTDPAIDERPNASKIQSLLENNQPNKKGDQHTTA